MQENNSNKWKRVFLPKSGAGFPSAAMFHPGDLWELLPILLPTLSDKTAAGLGSSHGLCCIRTLWYSELRAWGRSTGLGWGSRPAIAALPPWQARALIMQREDQMHPNMFAPATQCPTFSVVRISSLSLYFCSCHLRIWYNHECYDGYNAGKQKVLWPKVEINSLKLNQHLFKITSLMTQQLPNITRGLWVTLDSLLPTHKTMTFLVISLQMPSFSLVFAKF